MTSVLTVTAGLQRKTELHQQLLLDQDDSETHHQETVDRDFCTEECGKKHGILCRILTRLHLKHRDVDRQQLLVNSSDSIHATPSKSSKSTKRQKIQRNKKYEIHVDEECHEADECGDIECATNGREKNQYNLSSENNNVVKGSSGKPSANYHRLRSDDAGGDKYPDKKVKSLTREAKSIHVYGDSHFGEIYMCEEDASPLVEKLATDERTTGEYLKHKWHGKRVKKARKRFRRVMKATWVSFQAGLNINSLYPNTNTLATAFMPPNSRR